LIRQGPRASGGGLAACHLLVVLAVLILFQDRLTFILHVLQSLG
jgi:hypothetical protein